MIYIDFKEKGQKEKIAGAIEKETASELLGMIGHIAIFYRRQKYPEKSKINVPKRYIEEWINSNFSDMKEALAFQLLHSPYYIYVI